MRVCSRTGATIVIASGDVRVVFQAGTYASGATMSKAGSGPGRVTLTRSDCFATELFHQYLITKSEVQRPFDFLLKLDQQSNNTAY